MSAEIKTYFKDVKYTIFGGLLFVLFNAAVPLFNQHNISIETQYLLLIVVFVFLLYGMAMDLVSEC